MKAVKQSLQDHIQNSILKEPWQNIGIGHHHGINIPLFSIHSKDSCGIGEFLDLKLLIDFVASCKMDIIQLLPLNDSGYETSPYNAVSSLALNPIYLSLHALPFIKSDPDLQLDLIGFKKYTFLQKVAYNAVLTAKLVFLKKYFDTYFIHFEKSSPYKQFLKENPWLFEYGLFKCLKDDYAHKGWFSWEKKHQDLTTSYKKKLLKEKKDAINFYIFLQFLSFSQLEEVKSYSEEKKIFLKGDIPILISPESLDVWAGRKNFNLNYCAGAPPDQFGPEGQNWGFPIYNWQHMEECGYSFWRDRLKAAERFYHIFRIDHIIGLYRIYAIPRYEKSKGAFTPDDPSLAICQGERILNKLTSFTSMLPIGEDLGATNIEYIRKSLRKNAIAGTRIPRWERDFLKDNAFIKYDQYNPLSLTCVSTHDIESLSLWWNNNPKEAEAFASAYNMPYSKYLTHSLRYQILKDSHHTASLFHINLLSEYLALFEDLIWDNPEDERINLPGTIHPSNWCYKTRPSLETMLNHDDLKNIIKSLSS